MVKNDDTAQAELSVQAELTAMRAQLALERSQRISAEAAAFVQSEISASRVLPGERDGLIGLYAVLAQDDANDMRTPSRVEMLKQVTSARPSHAMISEFVPAEPVVLAVKAITPNADEAMIEASRSAAVAYAQRANGTKK